MRHDGHTSDREKPNYDIKATCMKKHTSDILWLN